MTFGKTIKIFLIDGDPNGRMSCELSNWTGKAYKIPRIKIKDCTDREDLISTGVYLLFGKDDDGKDLVYIGEAETTVPSMTSNFLNLRQKLIDEKAIVENGNSFEFVEDYIFSSPSTAVAMVMGRNTNGLTGWKLKSGRTLKDYESSEIISEA